MSKKTVNQTQIKTQIKAQNLINIFYLLNILFKYYKLKTML